MNLPRLVNPSGVAQNRDVAALREHVAANRVSFGPGQVGAVTPAGTLLANARGFRAPAYPTRARKPDQLTLVKTPAPGWERPATPHRDYVFCHFGTVDGFIPAGIDDPVVVVDTQATDAVERRVYIKAAWTPPVTLDLGNGVSPLWDTVELLATPTAAINASVLPPHGPVDPNTGYRAYYIFPIGRVQWRQQSGVWQLVLQSDDRGSIRTYPRTQPGGMRAADGPDSPPVWGVNVDFIAVRGPVV